MEIEIVLLTIMSHSLRNVSKFLIKLHLSHMLLKSFFFKKKSNVSDRFT